MEVAVPRPWLGAAIELGGGHLRGLGDLTRVGKGLTGQGVPAEDGPPGLLQVQPAGALGMNTCLMRGCPASQARVARL